MCLFSKDLETNLHSQGDNVEMGDSTIVSNPYLWQKEKNNINLVEMGE